MLNLQRYLPGHVLANAPTRLSGSLWGNEAFEHLMVTVHANGCFSIRGA